MDEALIRNLNVHYESLNQTQINRQLSEAVQHFDVAVDALAGEDASSELDKFTTI